MMAYISSIGDKDNCCLMLEKAESAWNIISTLLSDEENTTYGQYAVMVSREEQDWRLDIVNTFSDDPVIFGSADEMEQEMRKEILGEEDDETD